jgi:Glycosyl transferases group 1
MRKQKILVGTSEVCGALATFADGFRRLGHPVTSVIRNRDLYDDPKVEYDVDLNSAIIDWPEPICRSRSLWVRLPRGAINRLAHRSRMLRLMSHDIFVFQHAQTLQDNNSEYLGLKKRGRRIVSVFNGGDIRHPSAYDQQYAHVEGPGFSLEKLMAQDDRHRDLILEVHVPPLERPLRNLRMGELYADLILSVPNQSGLAVRPYMHFLVPVNLSFFKCSIPGRDVPVIVHAPSFKSVKGSKAILAALERLRSEGVPFDLHLLDGVPNPQVLAELAEADVAIDQLHFNLHGAFSLEAMASGCAVATCNREDCEPIPPNRPIWHIDESTLYERLKLLLSDRKLRVRLAHDARRHVEKYHDHVKVAAQIMRYLDNGVERYDHYPTFFARDYRLRDGETIPEDLKRMTAQIVQRWGLPQDVNPEDMIARGLMTREPRNPCVPIPRWPVKSSPNDFEAP